jgi:hypothetical protein
MDLTDTIIPKSDQINADDLISGPRTFTIKGVRRGSDEQPVNIDLVELPGRPFRPSKTVTRILVAAWGKESDAYTGRRLTLYRDPDVKFGGQDVGGIRVSHLSDIPKPVTLALTATRGKKSKHTVQPLPAESKPSRVTVDVGEPVAPAVTKEQLSAVNDGLTRLGIGDRDAKLATVSQVIDREVGSAAELTHAEAITVLSWIEHETTTEAQGTLA